VSSSCVVNAQSSRVFVRAQKIERDSTTYTSPSSRREINPNFAEKKGIAGLRRLILGSTGSLGLSSFEGAVTGAGGTTWEGTFETDEEKDEAGTLGSYRGLQ